MPPVDLRQLLACEIQSAGKRSSSFAKRLYNINWAHRLPKSGLHYPDLVKMVKIYDTAVGETILVLYPGKEAKRAGDAERPHDFFPVLYRKDGSRMEDLRFGRAFAAFQELVGGTSAAERGFMAELAACIYRMAFMLDHRLVDKPTLLTKSMSLDATDTFDSREYYPEEHPPFYAYDPARELRDILDVKVPSLGVSTEGLLKYCDIIGWNEDSKYSYRAKKKHEEKKSPGEPPWLGATGRINTLLTGLSVVGFEMEVVTFPELIDRFTSQRGVAPAHKDEVIRMAGGIVRSPQ